MTWLLRLYPPPWRRRYGGEVAEMLADQRFSLRIAIDLIAGAIDVWLHPSVTLAAAVAAEPHVEEKKTMLQRIARLDVPRVDRDGCGEGRLVLLDRADDPLEGVHEFLALRHRNL